MKRSEVPRSISPDRSRWPSRIFVFAALGPPVGYLAVLVLQAVAMAFSGRHDLGEVFATPFRVLEPTTLLAAYVIGIVPAALAGVLSTVSNRFVDRPGSRIATAPAVGLAAFLLADAVRFIVLGNSSLFPKYGTATLTYLATILLPPAVAALACVAVLERVRKARERAPLDDAAARPE
jgi:uncharacterized membrane protein